MKAKWKLNWILLVLLLCGGQLRSETEAGNAGGDTPAAEVEKDEKVLDVDDTVGIRKQTGSVITVEGTVRSAFWVNESVLMLTFREKKEGFIAVSFARHREKLDKAFNDSITEALKGRKVRITGKVTEYNDRPQIVIESPDQVKKLD